MQSRRHLRQDIRQRRKNLSQQYQHQAAYDLVQQCSTDLSIKKLNLLLFTFQLMAK